VEALNKIGLFSMEGALLMIFVCSKHVKDALKMIYIPHIRMISEQENISSNCQLCSNKAKYKLFNYVHQRKNTKEAI
jgi:CxxH/CxxC protein (TIGR04129 family)